MPGARKGFQAEGFGAYSKDMRSITSSTFNSFMEMLQMSIA
jgi:hypothetical protein